MIHNHFPAPDRDRVTRLFGSDFYKNCQPTINYDEILKQKQEEEAKARAEKENKKRKRQSNGTEVTNGLVL